MMETEQLIPYARNPRQNDDAVTKVASSIKEFGFQQPIVVDKDLVIIVGHTRLKAAEKLKMKKVPVLIADNLTEAQVKAYRIADNRVHEEAEWDDELLKLELDDLREFGMDLDLTGFDDEEIATLMGEYGEGEGIEDENGNVYSKKIEPPIYEMTGENPEVWELFNNEKTRKLEADIEAANIPDEIANFLRIAAQRHTVLKFSLIAEFYAHAAPEVQRLMEDNALVIVDIDRAIENGFVNVNKRFGDIFGENYPQFNE